MNSWDKIRQDDKFKKKLMTVKSTMHKCKQIIFLSYSFKILSDICYLNFLVFSNSSGNTASSVTNKKANNTINNKNYSNIANSKIKSNNKSDNFYDKNNIPNGIIQDQSIYGNRIENFQRQMLLRRLLKEFGLGQYLRVY